MTENVYATWGHKSASQWVAGRTEPAYMCLGTWTLSWDEGEDDIEIVRYCEVDKSIGSIKVQYVADTIRWRSSRQVDGYWEMTREDFSEAYIKSMVVIVLEYFYNQVSAFPGQSPAWEHALLLMGFSFEPYDSGPTDFNS